VEKAVLNGVMLLWFALTALSVAFVALDIRNTPESPVLKWGFVLIAVYLGPFGAFLYVLGCREPLSGLHERYVAVRWRQTLGSTMHCVAGDGVGILAGAAIGSILVLPPATELALEYALGFGFGWTIFQALFMRGMAGGSYLRSLAGTFVPEFLSMNFLMAGMAPTAVLGWRLIGGRPGPLSPAFWFVMSMALLAGFIVAYPINWQLVAKGLKHGMMTVRPAADGDLSKASATMDGGSTIGHVTHEAKASAQTAPLAWTMVMALLSVGAFVLAIAASFAVAAA